ncbi:MAG TPA: AAA family ATPase [Candidatus Woesebacteria bacterium]|nr:AAA family ATPase [Candidatus Woesebacteria bacterium]
MKIKKLAIRSIRGIVDIDLNFDGKNAVVHGTNGTGKSAVVDALDFLLTGQISRLMGEGTSGITLNRYGKHVDSTDLTQCFVEADLQVVDQADPITIKRYLNNPTELEVEEDKLPIIEEALDIAKKHQFLLTRREILRFITSDGSSRSSEIQKLLKLDEIGRTRRALVQIKNGLNSNRVVEERSLEALRTELHTVLGIRPSTSEEALVEINKYRNVLQVELLTNLDPDNFLTSVGSLDTQTQKKKPTQGEIVKVAEGLQTHLTEEHVSDLRNMVEALGESVAGLVKLGTDIKVIDTVDLLSQGLRVIHKHNDQERDNCPLCLSEIDSEQLEASIKVRLEKAGQISKAYDVLNRNKQQLSTSIGQLCTAINTLTQLLKEVSINSQGLVSIAETLEEVVTVLNLEVSPLLEKKSLVEILDKVFSCIELIKIEEVLAEVKSNVPSGTTREEAITILAKTQQKVREINEKKLKVAQAKVNSQRAVDLYDAFEESQNEVIDELYESIKDRFVELYRDLHLDDESRFQAQLQQHGASVDLSVDFYGRGQHPPHALHSEGHQDSMGICLYLALNEKVSEGKLQTIVLDDVVTSVDTQHRKELCKMLKSQFPDTQFIITTHDTTWAQQMKTHGVVDKKNLIKFYGWQVDSGPKYLSPLDIWEEIENALNEEDVHSASSKLRRFSEEFYLNMCVDLRANVPCKLDGGWTLGDLFPNAWKKYGDLLKEAQRAAASWDDEQLASEIETKKSQGDQIYTRAWQEAWGVNRTTHFTYWENMTKADFAPIVEAFKDFYDFFTCSSCNQTCYLTTDQSFQPDSLTCECGGISYKLKKKLIS